MALDHSRPSAWVTGYDLIADEYYEPRHITSRNFDAATQTYFREQRFPFPSDGLALDVGAGRGRLGEYCGISPMQILQLDLAPEMLRLPSRESALGRIQADALALPFKTGVFAIVAAFLFDPFNQRLFFEQVSRVLKRGGVFVGTIPHYAWGVALRSYRGNAVDEAVFALKTGERVSQPSFLSRPEELSERLEGAGLSVIKSEALTLPHDVIRISPDIEAAARVMGQSAYNIPIVQAVIATRA
ncbi:MAG: class I SAM-dependent methyltransferase [Acidobacteriia bacterium]|nr:class I SAM-dependent methyltransferase [Terriglobia bacterium]